MHSCFLTIRRSSQCILVYFLLLILELFLPVYLNEGRLYLSLNLMKLIYINKKKKKKKKKKRKERKKTGDYVGLAGSYFSGIFTKNT